MLNHEAYSADGAAPAAVLPARLLVVDSDDAGRDRLRILLTASGYHVTAAATVGNALAQDSVPDLAILASSSQEDISENIGRLKNAQSSHFLPLILLWAHTSSAKEQGFAAGADHVLVAPIQESEVLSSVRALLRLRFLSQNLADDAQELQRAYEILRVSESKYRALVQNAPVAIVIVDPDTNTIVEINQQGLQLCGYESDALVNQPLSQICAPETKSHLLACIAQAQTEQNLQHQGFLLRCCDGKIIPIEAAAIRADYEGKSLISLSLTDLRPYHDKAEAQTKAARQAVIAETAVTVSQEVNNALFVISSSIESLQQSLKDIDSSGRVKLERILEVCQRIDAFTQRLASVTEPVTKEYLPGMYMLDMERSLPQPKTAADEDAASNTQ